MISFSSDTICVFILQLFFWMAVVTFTFCAFCYFLDRVCFGYANVDGRLKLEVLCSKFIFYFEILFNLKMLEIKKFESF